MPASIIESLRAAEPQGFEVWPVNMPVIDAWLLIATQWRTISLADGRVHWQGLDYAAARAGFEMAGQPPPPHIFAGVQLMERTAGAVLNGFRG